MNGLKFIAVGVLLVFIASAANAFEEQKMQGVPGVAGSQPPAATGNAPVTRGNGLGYGTAALPPRQDEGTKIKVPGLGVIGEIPKMDFGLELLYGANQPKQNMEIDRDSEASGVMGRLRVPLKSP